MAQRLVEFMLDYWIALWVSGAAAAVLFLAFMLFHRIRVRRLEQIQFDLRVLVEQKSHSEGRYRELFDNATDAVFVTDLDGNITQLNRRAEALIGYEGAEARSMNLRAFLPETDAGARVRQQWLSGEADASEQIEITGRSGECVPCEVSTRLIEEAGKPHAVQAIARDVRERVALERQLHQAQKMEAVGQLAGGVAHDFNNLLTVIRGNAELALEALGDDDPVGDDIKQISQAADRAAVLTRQLLAFSRKQVLQPRQLDLNEILRGLQSMLQRLIGEDYSIQGVYTENPVLIVADPGQIEQVMLNLVVNARDAMPNGGTISVETSVVAANDKVQSANDRAVRISVSDTGMGMSRETQARIFEPFFTTKEVGKGTGLGLSTVFGIVQQSGGHIEVSSQPGVGTTFQILWPHVATPAFGQPDVAASAGRQGGTETILLVEDDDAVRALAGGVLRRLGYKLLEAREAQDAFAVARDYAERIDLLLTDVVMPGENGLVLSRRLNMVRPDMRILLMSGYTDEEILRRGLLDPGTAYLQKPFTPDTLGAKVRVVLDKADDEPHSRSAIA
jgi:PAS domain S-box-containing protein